MVTRFICILSLILLCAATMNCAPGNDRWDPDVSPGARANFWAGIWHGLIIIVTFVVSLFTSEVGIYEVNNVGWGYNLGFLVGLSFIFGPILKGSSRKKRLSKCDLDKIGDTIEERVRKGIKSWLEESDRKEARDKDWEDIAGHVEQKIKDALKDWK